MKKIKDYLANEVINKETLAYIFWGGITAFSTVVLYFIFVNKADMNVGIANLIANLIGIIFAYYTQKKYVFSSSNKTREESKKELIKFFSGRIITFILETILLVILVDMFGFDKNITKIFTSFVTVIFNYFVAKIAVFND